MTFDIVFGVGGREVADRALEHWLTHVALSNVAGKFTAVHILLTKHAKLEGVGVAPLPLIAAPAFTDLLAARCPVAAIHSSFRSRTAASPSPHRRGRHVQLIEYLLLLLLLLLLFYHTITEYLLRYL